ncbi:MAG: phosphate ABC transporter substrate-binding protein PstS family protein [Luteitalea sp.]|nr:phosphate ABC transporter substrate-binding protein PstS family protein [Luteitalea sp.]
MAGGPSRAAKAVCRRLGAGCVRRDAGLADSRHLGSVGCLGGTYGRTALRKTERRARTHDGRDRGLSSRAPPRSAAPAPNRSVHRDRQPGNPSQGGSREVGRAQALFRNRSAGAQALVSLGTPSFVLLAAALLTIACGQDDVARAVDADIRADGSSTVYPITSEAARRYRRTNRQASIDVRFSGTTGGFGPFCAGETDISDASRPINADEMMACAKNSVEFIEVPIAMDAVAIVVHPDNDWARDITIDELRALWSPAAAGTITTWRQVRSDWPDRPIHLFGRGQDSGTYDYFTGVIVGEIRSSRMDYTASEDIQELVAGISADPEALGFFGVGAYFSNWEALEVLRVDSGSGPVLPNLQAVQAGTYQPLTRPLFLYINARALADNDVLEDFVLAYLDGVRDWVVHTGYMPLSQEASDLALSHFRARRVGSFYAGKLSTDESIEAVLIRAAGSS